MNTFWSHFKFALRSLCQASMITFVEFLSECLRIRDFFFIFLQFVEGTSQSIRYGVKAPFNYNELTARSLNELQK